MSAEAPTSGELRRLGAAVILVIAILGFTASSLPGLLRADSLEWEVTIPISDGADGIEVGGEILVGGVRRGRIIAVGQGMAGSDPSDVSGDPIRVGFELDRKIVLARDAVIQRGSETGGIGGYLNISFLGTKNARFEPWEQRIIPLSRTTRPGGPIAGIIGRTNGEMIQSLNARSNELTRRSKSIQTRFDRDVTAIHDQIQSMDLVVGEDVVLVMDLLRTLFDRYRTIFERIPVTREIGRNLGAEVGDESSSLNIDLDRWRDRLARLDLGDHGTIRRFSERIGPRLRTVADDLQHSMDLARSVATRSRPIAPEVSEGLDRTRARMVLAGGQLRQALEDLVPLALQAITTRPDEASESRRLLLESTNDVVLAGMELRDAARRLEGIQLLDESSSPPESDASADLGRSLQIFERTMQRLAERLRWQIESDLR